MMRLVLALIAYYRRPAYPALAADAPLRHMPTHDRCYTEMRDGTCWYAPLDDCERR